MLNIEPIKTRLELIEGAMCYQEDPVRGDWLVMAGSRVMAVCRYPWEAMVFAHYQKDVLALVEEVERLRDGIQKHKGEAMAAVFEGRHQPEQDDWDLWGLLDA